MKLSCGISILAAVLFSCNKPKDSTLFEIITKDSSEVITCHHSVHKATPDNTRRSAYIATGKTTPSQLITFARSLEGTPYKYGSIDPEQGFDCSGFVTYVFNHFGISVPRRSVDFTSIHRKIDIKNVKSGDLILFTGTDSTIRTVGHIGIILSNDNKKVIFIHATSGKRYDVTETRLNLYYQARYIESIRIFP